MTMRIKSKSLKAYLKGTRERCNQVVATLRHQHPNIRTDDLTWFFVHCLDPLMIKFDDQNNQITFKIAQAGFEFGLELIRFNWLKSDEKKELLTKVWCRFYPEVEVLVTQSPDELFAGTFNSFSNISLYGNEKADAWLDCMIDSAGLIGSIDHFKSAGVVCAWSIGLAHFRPLALSILRELPHKLSKQLLNLTEHEDLLVFLENLSKNSWFHSKQLAAQHGINEQFRIGKCALVGGDFSLPPKVFVSEDQLYVLADHTLWRLYADKFGATLILDDQLEQKDVLIIEGQIKNDSKLSSLANFEDILDINSSAKLDNTVVFTSDETFSVIISCYFNENNRSLL